jgi:hypothetical protein
MTHRNASSTCILSNLFANLDDVFRINRVTEALHGSGECLVGIRENGFDGVEGVVEVEGDKP